MAEKRKRDDVGPDAATKKQKKGFSVGPANLPDGTYKRRVQKIKKNLIAKAKIKKDYAKIKKQAATTEAAAPNAAQINDTDSGDNAEPPVPASLELHAERQAMLDDSEKSPEDQKPRRDRQEGPRQRRQRTNPYEKQVQRAEQLKAEAEQRRQEREAAIAERDRKREERERWRRQMAKAKQPGKDGKRKLGRESKLLLERVQRLVGEDKA